MRTTAPSPSPSTASPASSPSPASRSEAGAKATAPASLSAAIVTYRSDSAWLARALGSLAREIIAARAQGMLCDARVDVIDNGPAEGRGPLESALAAWDPEAGALRLIAGHGNVGYGRGNNLVLGALASDLHLVMNPDVELEEGALAALVQALRDHPQVGLAAPAVRGDDGGLQYLCKRYPSLWVLFLRGFAPHSWRQRHAARLAQYEMRDVIGERYVEGIALASGCFMLMRTPLFVRAGGFDPRFFMYFEDYDLSMRLGREARIAYVPAARIVHHGGNAARKGWRHVAWFITSACRFFAAHGWKIA